MAILFSGVQAFRHAGKSLTKTKDEGAADSRKRCGKMNVSIGIPSHTQASKGKRRAMTRDTRTEWRMALAGSLQQLVGRAFSLLD